MYTDCSVKHQKYFVCCCFLSSPVFTAQRVCIAQTMPWQNVCPSVTRRYCVKTVTHILKRFQPSGSPTILVFPHQTRWQYSDGDPAPPNGGVDCNGFMKYHFTQPITQCIVHNRPKHLHVVLVSCKTRGSVLHSINSYRTGTNSNLPITYLFTNENCRKFVVG